MLVTRVDAGVRRGGARARSARAEYDAAARTLWLGPAEVPIVGKGTIAVVSPAPPTCRWRTRRSRVARRFGNKVELLVDVGVAGLHRLLAAMRDAARGARR